jgi:hypothetical protein
MTQVSEVDPQKMADDPNSTSKDNPTNAINSVDKGLSLGPVIRALSAWSELRKADIDKFDRTSNIPRHKIREMLRNR